MRPLELAFFAAIVLVGHIAGQLPILACLTLASGALAAVSIAAGLRHRIEFRRATLHKGDRVLSFRQPPSVWGNPMPYSWWLCRSWYKASIQSADGERHDYWVMAEGVFFGLFRISLVCCLKEMGPYSGATLRPSEASRHLWRTEPERPKLTILSRCGGRLRLCVRHGGHFLRREIWNLK